MANGNDFLGRAPPDVFRSRQMGDVNASKGHRPPAQGWCASAYLGCVVAKGKPNSVACFMTRNVQFHYRRTQPSTAEVRLQARMRH